MYYVQTQPSRIVPPASHPLTRDISHPKSLSDDEYIYARQYWLDHIALAHAAGSASEVLRGQVKLALLRREYYN